MKNKTKFDNTINLDEDSFTRQYFWQHKDPIITKKIKSTSSMKPHVRFDFGEHDE